MPVRQLMYLGRQYDKYIKRTKQNMYGTKQMKLPIPRLVVFYNGKDDKNDQLLKLSDSFSEETDKSKSDVEVTVHMYNIKSASGSKLLTECKVLSEYAWFVERIRNGCETMDRDAAIDMAIKDMPDNFSIKSFLTEHRSEVKNMLITEYDEAETMEMFKEEGREEGLIQGRAEGRAEGREEGREEHLIRQICRKLKKGKTVSQIADDLEEDESIVSSICKIAEKYASDYDVTKILQDKDFSGIL